MEVANFTNIKNNKFINSKKVENRVFFGSKNLRKIFPKLEPYNTFRFKVSDPGDEKDLHELYVECSGRKNGKPIVFLHGGPGQGIDNEDRRWFNPHFFNAILFDQRGSGKSTPLGDVYKNKTSFLVNDMEKLREHLNIEKWALYGISWGATLALKYASEFPKSVSGMVLRGVTPNPENATNWLFKEGGCSKFFPEAWEKFKNFIPQAERANLLEAYYKRLSSSDPTISIPAAKAYDEWGYSYLTIFQKPKKEHEITAQTLAASKLECFYFLNNCFIFPDYLKKLRTLKDIPIEIVQGRYDMIAPPENAFEIKKLIPDNPNINIEIVEEAGHSTADLHIRHAELTALDRLQEKLKNNQ